MAKTSYFNNGKPQVALPNKQMQPVVVSDRDKPLCWDCLWKPLVICCGFIPYVTGVPEDCKPLPQDEVEAIQNRWDGEWKIQPLPPMAVTGRNAKFYIQHTTAHIDGDSIIVSGGFHYENQTSRTSGSVGGPFNSTPMSATTSTMVQAQNEGTFSKLIFSRSPEGTLYIDNVGSYVISEETGKIKIMTAFGYPMTIYRSN